MQLWTNKRLLGGRVGLRAGLSAGGTAYSVQYVCTINTG